MREHSSNVEVQQLGCAFIRNLGAQVGATRDCIPQAHMHVSLSHTLAHNLQASAAFAHAMADCGVCEAVVEATRLLQAQPMLPSKDRHSSWLTLCNIVKHAPMARCVV